MPCLVTPGPHLAFIRAAGLWWVADWWLPGSGWAVTFWLVVWLPRLWCRSGTLLGRPGLVLGQANRPRRLLSVGGLVRSRCSDSVPGLPPLTVLSIAPVGRP